MGYLHQIMACVLHQIMTCAWMMDEIPPSNTQSTTTTNQPPPPHVVFTTSPAAWRPDRNPACSPPSTLYSVAQAHETNKQNNKVQHIESTKGSHSKHC